MTPRSITLRFGLAMTCLAIAAPALAHTGIGSHFHFSDGFFHPLMGADHLAQMVVIGLLAARTGARALALWPLSFVAGLTLGALAAAPGLPIPGIAAVLPYLQIAIVAGLIAAALVAAAPATFPVVPLGLAIAAIGVAHGVAHGAEAPAGDFSSYVAGFLTASAVLHLLGAVAGLLLLHRSSERTLQMAGVVIALAGAIAGATGG